jgi:CubicO group peptidase (beta-lactamase class C family)
VNERDGVDLNAMLESISEDIPGLLEERKLPGLAVGICDASGGRWSDGLGTVRAGHKQPIRTSTMFSAQSASKMYTATAVMLAVQQGLVDLDEPITRYLPEFTVKSRFESTPENKITLRHLLSHTAGFTHEAPVGGNFEVGRGSFEAHCRSISDTWLRFPVGHHPDYSNLGIDIAAYILQRRSRLPFHEFVRRELLAPLGLARTTFDHRIIAREKDRALGHDSRQRRIPVRVPMVAAGGLYTSVDDALRYLQFHLRQGEGLLDSRLLEEMYGIPFPAPRQQLGFGLGIIIARWEPGIQTYGHSGGGFGFRCQLNWVPDSGVGVVVLTNSSVDHKTHVDISQRIIGELGGRSAADAPESLPRRATISQEMLDRLVGEYIGGRDTAKVVLDGENLAVLLAGDKHPACVVAPDQIILEEVSSTGGSHLFTVKRRERYRFLPGDDGRPRYMQRLEDGYVGYRNDPFPSDQPIPFDPQWEGKYRIKVSGVTLTGAELRNDNGCPVLALGEAEDASILRLGQHRPGIYFSPEGEALDLTQTPPTYANIKLFKIE